MLNEGKQPDPPVLDIQYKDFSSWQNQLLKGEGIKSQWDYWLELYADASNIEDLLLPTDYKRPEMFTAAGAEWRFQLTPEHTQPFESLASQCGGTLNMNIIAAINTLLYIYSGQSDIIIGNTVSGRSQPGLQRIMGLFVNTLAMRNYPTGEKSYRDFVKEVVKLSFKALENQDVQFEELVDKLNVRRDMSRNPLLDICFSPQNFRKTGDNRQPDTNAEKHRTVKDKSPKFGLQTFTSKFDITFTVFKNNGAVSFRIEYYTGIFHEDTIRRMAGHLENIIKTVKRDPSIRLKDIEIISPREKEQLLI
ncbi:MAG: hypothetical protein GY940_21940, partial [bacterium]|nr:hypothetical protein [bacterium]